MSVPSPQYPPGFLSAEHFLAAIIDSSDDAIVSKNLDGIVTSWNAGAERIFGYPAEEMVGQPILKLIPVDRREEEPMILARLRNGERVDHFETKRVRKDGKIIDISLTISPVRNAEGIIVGASKVARDITLQKQAGEALVRASEETGRQSRMKDEFLATLSHELRTPLQSISGWVQLLRSGSLAPGELEQGLEVIARNVQAQQRIIDDLLDMNRILSGKVRLDVQRIDLSGIVQAAVDTIRPAAHAKQIRLTAVLDPLAKAVSGDPQRLQQVFWNLLTNAVKFTPKNGHIEVLLARNGSHLEVTVTDSGAGITADFLPHVFDRFRQEDQTMSRSQGGLGLGLAIVKHLVELHGGRVTAQSPGPGLGAVFTVILPMAALAERGLSPSEDSTFEPALPSLPDLAGISVLILDDDRDSQVLLEKTVAKAGAHVRTATSVDEALTLIDHAVPRIIVSDIGMPEKDGYAFIQSLRARQPEQGGRVPAIALSAYTRVEDRVRAISAGFQMSLSKPVEAIELLVTIQSLAKE